MNKPSPKPKRRFLRVSLRTLFVLLTVGCVWLGWKVNKAQKQRAAVAWIREMGGEVTYDCGIGDDPFTDPFGDDRPVPAWLIQLIGIDLLSDVEYVDCDDIAGLSDLSPLARLTELRTLSLANTSVSDLTPLARLKKLEILDLSSTNVSDLKPLAKLENLECLSLTCTFVADLTPLANLKCLGQLFVSHSDVGDLTPLAGLSNLERLDVSFTFVSDSSGLGNLKQLKELRVFNSQVSAQDVVTLQQSLPNCRIDHW